MSLEFTTKTLQAATVFKEYRNTIDIYTEDCDKDKEFYIRLLQRLLCDTGIVINDIHPLGCRRTVIDCCQKDNDTRRKKLYIVDGDIYLQYKDKEIIPNLFVLDAYCIENYVICEESICHVAYLLHARESYDTIRSILQIPQELNTIAQLLIKLFFYYSIQIELFGQYELRTIEAFMDKTSKCINNTLIESRIDEIITGLEKHGFTKEMINELYQQRERKFPYNIDTLLQIVSGKDYLIPYLRYCFDRKLKLNIKIPKETWKFNLVDNADLTRLISLRDAVVDAVKEAS